MSSYKDIDLAISSTSSSIITQDEKEVNDNLKQTFNKKINKKKKNKKF
jgi:hypothetical protein